MKALIGHSGYTRAQLIFMSINCRLLQPVIALPKEARVMITIPAGTVVEVLPKLRKGAITEVLWEGECFSTPLGDLLAACPRNEERLVGLHRVAEWESR